MPVPTPGIASGDYATLGENSRMLVGGIQNDQNFLQGTWIRFVGGSVGVTAAPVDATDNMSGGFTEDSRGPRSLLLGADCIWRANDNPISKPVRFEEGQNTERIIVWPDFVNDPATYYKMPIGFCRGFNITLSGVSEVRFSLDLKNQKIYYTPSRPDPKGVAW